jgi:ABC-type molybdenum transport system ATPase subunit/photorepair protein PhrA
MNIHSVLTRQELRALLGARPAGGTLEPGALGPAGRPVCCLADPGEAESLRALLPAQGLVWLGWRQREALLRAWRPAAQERYHSVAGRDAPGLETWLAERFKAWKQGPRGDWWPEVERGRMLEAVALCGLEALLTRPVSLLSNGEVARACLAAALGAQPGILVLDDLSEGMDTEGRGRLWAAAQALARKGPLVILLASRESLLPWAPAGSDGHALAAVRGSGEEVFACAGLNLEAGDRLLVRGLDWRLCEGEAWWLRGPNGAGKSTLLAYLSGEHPQAWAQSWRLQGHGREAWTPLDALRARRAWVSPELAALAGRPLEDMLEQALDSGAPLLLLDEALRGLDAGALRRCEERLGRALEGNYGRCVVFVSHDAQEVPAWINRVLSLDAQGGWDIRP